MSKPSRGILKRWDQWPEIRKTNPLTSISADFRKQLLRESGMPLGGTAA